MIEVVTVYTARKSHEKYMDFGPLLECQKKTAEKWGHKHVVVSDQKLKGMNVFNTELPASLMQAILAGQIAYLEAWDEKSAIVLVDVDCLVARSLEHAFILPFDLGLTNREDPRCPINNGAMYIKPGNKAAVLAFFRAALAICKSHWGGDQEAISYVAAPVPIGQQIVARHFGELTLRLAFFSMLSHNCIPRYFGVRHKKNPYIVHFKGEERKSWMKFYAYKFILNDAGGLRAAN